MWRDVRTCISQPYRPCSLCTRRPFLRNIRSYIRLFRVWHKNFTMLGKVAQEPEWGKQMVSAIDIYLNILEMMSTFEAACKHQKANVQSDAPLHVYGDGNGSIHQSCPDPRLVTASDSSRDVHQVLLRPWQNKLCTYDLCTCVPCWDVIPKWSRSRNPWRAHPRKLVSEQECSSTVLPSRSRQCTQT